jgi:uncharacterized protein (TIGR00255 family)
VAMSMTAYARVTTETAVGSATWELRSVNNRYLDASVRLPEELRGLDGPVRERLSARFKRGKVDCGLRLDTAAKADAELAVDIALVEQLAAACKRIDGVLTNSGPVCALDVLKWPGVLGRPTPALEGSGAPLLTALETTIDEFLASRNREGTKLAELIAQRCDGIEGLIKDVRCMLPDVIAAYRERLNARLEEVREELDPGRLEAEIVVFCQKTDVSEELDRLATHVTEVRRVLALDEPIGRRLDFLMQELNREANTLGSKSVDTRSTAASVDLKVLIEQMREQVQNLE